MHVTKQGPPVILPHRLAPSRVSSLHRLDRGSQSATHPPSPFHAFVLRRPRRAHGRARVLQAEELGDGGLISAPAACGLASAAWV